MRAPCASARSRRCADDERRHRKLEAEIEQVRAASAEIAAGLAAIAAADPSFSPKSFLEGAKAAYEMIVTAFAAGDRKTLKNLLEKDVYDGFETGHCRARDSRATRSSSPLSACPVSTFPKSNSTSKTAQITIRFKAEIVSATRDADGALVEGNADQVMTIKDEWTFARNVRSRDPNWKLVATSQLD